MQKRKKTRKEKIAEQQKEKNKKKPFNKVNFFFGIICFIGISLTIIEISIYRNTMIKWFIPFSIWLISGITSTIILVKFFKIDLKNNYAGNSWIMLIFYNCLSFGGILLFTFMYINFNSTDSNIQTHKLKILRKSSIRDTGNKARRIPVVDVNYQGLIKEVVLSRRDKDKLENSSYIILKMKKGILGFDVITEEELTE